MARYSRLFSESGIYHIMIRGNERKDLFKDDEDRTRFLDTIYEKVLIEGAEVYAYCLMSNHVHLLIGVDCNNLTRLMKRINTSYAYYFNNKYQRVGHLFQDRFRSESIDSDTYFLEAVRYIHNNPVKAGISKTPAEYEWSSFNGYLGSKEKDLSKERVLGLFSDNPKTAVARFLEYSDKYSEFILIELEEKTRQELKADKETEALDYVVGILKERQVFPEFLMEKRNVILRNEIIEQLKERYELSARQIEKVTGVGRGTVMKIIKSCSVVNGVTVSEYY